MSRKWKRCTSHSLFARDVPSHDLQAPFLRSLLILKPPASELQIPQRIPRSERHTTINNKSSLVLLGISQVHKDSISHLGGYLPELP